MRPSPDATAQAGTAEADAALMRRLGAGDASACRALVDAHLRPVVGFAYRLLRDPGDAEDVTQETFLRLWRQAPRWRQGARVSTWLYRVTHNLCMDRLRRRRDVPTPEAPEAADPAPGAAAMRQRGQVGRAVEAALAGLPERQRTAIALVHYHELANTEAAEIMGISVEALESLLARGRRGLRRQLEPLRDDLLGDV